MFVRVGRSNLSKQTDFNRMFRLLGARRRTFFILSSVAPPAAALVFVVLERIHSTVLFFSSLYVCATANECVQVVCARALCVKLFLLCSSRTVRRVNLECRTIFQCIFLPFVCDAHSLHSSIDSSSSLRNMADVSTTKNSALFNRNRVAFRCNVRRVCSVLTAQLAFATKFSAI